VALALVWFLAVVQAEPNAEGERQIWLDAAVVDRLAAIRRPGESFSDVILRLFQGTTGGGGPGGY